MLPAWLPLLTWELAPAFLIVLGLAKPEGTLFPRTSEGCGVPTVEPPDGIVGSSQVSGKSSC